MIQPKYTLTTHNRCYTFAFKQTRDKMSVPDLGASLCFTRRTFWRALSDCSFYAPQFWKKKKPTRRCTDSLHSKCLSLTLLRQTCDIMSVCYINLCSDTAIFFFFLFSFYNDTKITTTTSPTKRLYPNQRPPSSLPVSGPSGLSSSVSCLSLV